MSKGKFILGSVLGAIAGAIGGVLLAPKSGEETRNDIKRKAGEVGSEAEHEVDRVKQSAESLVHRGAEEVEDAAAKTAKKTSKK